MSVIQYHIQGRIQSFPKGGVQISEKYERAKRPRLCREKKGGGGSRPLDPSSVSALDKDIVHLISHMKFEYKYHLCDPNKQNESKCNNIIS